MENISPYQVHENSDESLPKPARFYKGRPVYSSDQLKQMILPYPSEESWLKEIDSELGSSKK